MKATIIACASVAVLIVAANPAAAATFTSTKGPRFGVSNAFNRGVPVGTYFERIDNAQDLSSKSSTVPVAAGINSMTLSVDTVTDKADIVALDLQAPSLPTLPFVLETSANVDYQILIQPGNFPDPPIYKQVTGFYTSRITINSYSASTPTRTGSTPVDIIANPSTPGSYDAFPLVTLSESSITLNGVYELIGPSTTVSQPFSRTYVAPAGLKSGVVVIPPTANLADGFLFQLGELGSSYNRDSSGGGAPTLLFDQIVDDVRFQGNVGRPGVDFFPAPEPGSATLAVSALALGSILRRHGRTRGRSVRSGS